MKYTQSIEINLPRERVVELFDNPENLKQWMKGLQTFESVSGTPGQEGAKSKLTFDMGGRKMEMLETITVRDLPNEFSGTYEGPGTWSLTRNLFEDLGNGRTRITAENEFRFDSLPMKIFGLLLPWMFKAQSMQYLKDFKTFAEAQGN
jgi:carbon monoxide dehydrogenase subunit G